MSTVFKLGWSVAQDRVLGACIPKGYELWETEDHFFLYRGERRVADFSALTPLSDLVRAIAWEVSQDGNR